MPCKGEVFVSGKDAGLGRWVGSLTRSDVTWSGEILITTPNGTTRIDVSGPIPGMLSYRVVFGPGYPGSGSLTIDALSGAVNIKII